MRDKQIKSLYNITKICLYFSLSLTIGIIASFVPYCIQQTKLGRSANFIIKDLTYSWAYIGILFILWLLPWLIQTPVTLFVSIKSMEQSEKQSRDFKRLISIIKRYSQKNIIKINKPIV